MKEIEVFIAGSKTLTQLRDSARAALMELNNQYRELNVMFRPYTFEDFPRSFSVDGRQADYNCYISEQADYVVFIFDEGFGEITLKELDVAMHGLKINNRPQIYVYCNEAKMSCDKFKEIQNKLNAYGQYYIAYEEGHFKDQLKQDFMAVLIKSVNLPQISAEKKTDIVKELYDALSVSTESMYMMIKYVVDSGDCTFSVQVSNNKRLMDALRKSREVLSKDIYEIALNYAKDVVEKGFNWVLEQFRNTNKTSLNGTELQRMHDTLIKDIVNLDETQRRIDDIQKIFSDYIEKLYEEKPQGHNIKKSTCISSNNLFVELAKNLNDLYVNSILVFVNFPQMDNSQIYEMMKQPCEGAYKIKVQDFSKSIYRLAIVLNKILQNSDAIQVYKQRLQAIESKVQHLYPDGKMLDMNSLIDVVNMLDAVQKLLQNPTMDRLITAQLATNVGKGKEYDNVNIRSLFYIGNIIYNEVTPNYVNNLGAAILHDLFMILPDDCKALVSSDFSKALSGADEIGDLYHISLNS